MAGYCDKGPTCDFKHPMNFIPEDFKYIMDKNE